MRKRFLLKLIYVFISIFFCLLPCKVVADRGTVVKQEKAILKKLKKKYKTKRAEYRSLPSGHKYIYITTKDYDKVVADSTGKVIIATDSFELKGFNMVECNKAYVAGEKVYNYYARRFETSFIGTDECFVAFDNDMICFYNIKGELLNAFSCGRMYDYGCYYKCVTYNIEGVASKNGMVLIPFEYENVYSVATGCFVVSKTKGGIEYKGAYRINDDSIFVVPCMFNRIEFDESKEKWLVAVHEFDSLSLYDESKVYDMGFLDNGEKLFAQRKFEEARKFYYQNTDKPWSGFYIGATYYKEALHEKNRIELLIENLDRSDDENDVAKCDYLISAYDLLCDKIKKAICYLELPRKDGNPYYDNAGLIKYELNELSDAKSLLWDRIVVSVENYENRCEKKRQLQIETEMEQLRQKERELDLREQQLRHKEHELREHKKQHSLEKKLREQQRLQQQKRQPQDQERLHHNQEKRTPNQERLRHNQEKRTSNQKHLYQEKRDNEYKYINNTSVKIYRTKS